MKTQHYINGEDHSQAITRLKNTLRKRQGWTEEELAQQELIDILSTPISERNANVEKMIKYLRGAK